MNRKTIIGIIVTLAVLVGGFFVLRGRQSSVVKVYSSDMISITDDWSNQYTMTGVVTTDKLQPVYVSKTQTITDILVTENQEVKKGDILLTYDSTLSELSLVRKNLEIQKLQLDINRASKELEVINTYRPGVPITLSIDNTRALMVLAQQETSNPNEFIVQFVGVDATQIKAPKVNLYQKNLIDDTESLVENIEPTIIVNEENNSIVYTYIDLEIDETMYAYRFVLLDENGLEVVLESEFTLNEELFKLELIENKLTVTKVEEEQDEPDPIPPSDIPNLIAGTGSKDDPYQILYTDDLEIDSNFLDAVFSNHMDYADDLFVDLNIYSENNPKNDLLQSIRLKLYRIGEFKTFSIIEIVQNLPDLPPIDEPGFDDEPPFDFPHDPGPPSVVYTADEIFKMKSEKEAEIRGLTLNKKTAEMELKNLEREKNNNFVLAELDGIVGEIIDPEEAISENKQLFSVSSSGGFVVTVQISELDLETVKPGDIATVFSYETGTQAEGIVQSISPYPTENQMYFGSGPFTQSYYPMKIFVDKSASLKEGSWVEVTLMQKDDDVPFFAVMSAFVRTDEKEPYVWVVEDEKLTKRFVSVGRNLYGMYTEITDGSVTPEDRLAFPYGKNLREGAPIQEGTFEDLYGGGIYG